MSLVRSIDVTNVITSQTVTSTTETIIATGPKLYTPKDVWQCVLSWFVEATAGATQTSAIFRIRKGTTLSGSVIGNPQAIAMSGGTIISFGGMEVDTGSSTDYTQYVLTVQQAGGAGNMTVSEASLLALTF